MSNKSDEEWQQSTGLQAKEAVLFLFCESY